MTRTKVSRRWRWPIVILAGLAILLVPIPALSLDGYDLNTTADPGQPAQLTFTADKTGAFRFRCSVTCGALHPFMIGKLTVGANDLLWRAIGLAVLAAAASGAVCTTKTPRHEE